MRTLSLYSEVTPQVAEQFKIDLSEIADSEPLTLHINSPGGEVLQGRAIYTLLARRPGRVTVIIDGIAASMASYIAMAGREIVMAESAMMMIHNPKSWAGGSGQDLRKLASTLDKIREDFISAYASRSRRSRADVAKMMDDETWMDANEAVAAGFADRIEGHGRIVAFNLSRFKHPPLISATSSCKGRMVYRNGRLVEDSVPETIIRQS